MKISKILRTSYVNGPEKAWLDSAAERTVAHLAEKKVFGPGRLKERTWNTRIEACQAR